MSISHALLGLLSQEPLSGYDLKKRIADSTIMYWSGNNNQIYSSLVQLHKDGFVTYEHHFEEGSPAKKIYSITQEGMRELKAWLVSPPEPPENQNPFHIRLLWIDMLPETEIESLLTNYEEEVRVRLIMEQEKARRTRKDFTENGLGQIIVKMIHSNIAAYYENEISWVQKVREAVLREAASREVASREVASREAAHRKGF